MFKPISVKALPGYKLHVRYRDGVEGEVDLSPLVGNGVFALWNDPSAFENVSIGESGEIRWSDQVDLCPDALYLQITGKSPEEVNTCCDQGEGTAGQAGNGTRALDENFE